jgi:hypothetical protein
MVHAHFGFYMNWFGQQKGEGFEYHLLAIGLAVAVLIRSAGSFSIDGLLSKSTAGAQQFLRLSGRFRGQKSVFPRYSFVHNAKHDPGSI